MQSELKKIFVISLTDKKKFKAYAAFNGEELVIQRMESIVGIFSSWKKPLIEEIEQRKSQGFMVLVEEKTDHIARYATQFLFEDKDEEEGRINLFVAFDWYFSINNIGNLVVPKDADKYLFNEGIIDKVRDEQGRLKYNIEWDKFSGGHRVILLAVMATVLNPVSRNYLEQMYGKQVKEEINDPWASFRAITAGVDLQRARQWEPDNPKLWDGDK
jgi:hypothetical protein